MRPTPPADGPLVTILVPVADPAGAEAAGRLHADLQGQEVPWELLVLDRSEAGGLGVEGAVRVHAPHPALGVAVRQALPRCRGRYVAWLEPEARPHRDRLVPALRRLEDDPDVDLVLAPLEVVDSTGRVLAIPAPEAWGEAPPPGWASTATFRREALERIGETAFHPVLLVRYRELLAAGRVALVDPPAVRLAAAPWLAARAEARLDALLATPEVYDGPPEISVVLATHDRRPVLLRCLESFCRQPLPRGAYEIVVVDDGSTDGTRACMETLRLPVPFRYTWKEAEGASAARNVALTLAQGRLCLWVNDDTVAFPDLLQRHIAFHRRMAPHKVMALGTFEQPPEAVENALVRHLEGSTEVFLYSQMRPGAVVGGAQLYTCNVSVPTEAVRELGGFDAGFPRCLGEDTDMGIRLEARGWRLHYRPEARARHHHQLGFDDLVNRQRFVARAFVRLFQKHPEVLLRWGVAGLTSGEARASLEKAAPDVPALEASARQLAGVDLGALERAGVEGRELAADISDRLARSIKSLNGVWWREGYLEGLQEHGLSGFPELLLRAPLPLPERHRRATLLLPRGPDPEAWRPALAAWVAAHRGDGEARLLVRALPQPGVDGPTVARVVAEVRGAAGEGAPAVEVVELELPQENDFRLLGSVGRWLPWGDPAEAVFWDLAIRGDVPREVLAPRPDPGPVPVDEGAVLAVPRHFAVAGDPGGELPPGPLLSVVVATRDRPGELARLLGHLAAQDLPPDRFEVHVVDDGSSPPLVCDAGAWPFPLVLHRTAGVGPGPARNRALPAARGTWVLFLNDDGVPAPDLLRQHLLLQAAQDRPRVLMGTFDLLPHLLDTPFRTLVARSTLLFPQPKMTSGRDYPGLSLCTGNLSLPLAHLRAVGGFDPFFQHAGGEDSDLGVRLARRFEMPVRFDDRLRCDHDHALALRPFLRRQHLMGWYTWHLAAVHGDPSIIVGPDAPAPEAPFWRALEERVLAREPEVGAELARALAAEAGDPLPDPEFEALVRRLGYHAFAWGMLRAEAGQPPLDPRAAPSTPAPAEAP